VINLSVKLDKTVVVNYIPSIIDRVLAIVTLAFITYFINPVQYGVFTAVQGVAFTLFLAFPIEGFNRAIAFHAKGDAVHAATAVAVTLSLVYAVVAIPLAALLVRSPLTLMYATAVVTAYILLNLFNAGYVHMWVNNRTIEMGRGLMAYTLTFRAGELLLIALTRSPLAIAAAAIAGYAVALVYYYREIGRLPSLRRGLRTIKGRFRRIAVEGWQFYILRYTWGFIHNGIIGYLAYMLLGAGDAAVFAVALGVVVLVTALGDAVKNVSTAGASITMAKAREWAIRYTAYGAGLTTLLTLLLPVATWIHVINGIYVDYTWFIAGLAASAIPSIPNGVIMMTMWLNGKGWYPAYAGTLGAIANVIVLTTLAHPLGIWAIVAANLTGNTTTLAMLLTRLA
jgi:O-antigen/teichoic acid export membrane protein